MSALTEEKLHRLIEVGRGIVAELEVDAVLDRVLEVACELTGARYAALGVLDERREELERFITRGVDDETHAAIGSLPRGHGVLGTLIRRPEPLRLADVGSHPESWGFPPAHPAMTTFLGVPILIRGQAYGNIYLTDKEGGGEFDDADEEAMLVLADWAAVGINNAQAHRRVRGRRDELERAVRALEATTEIVRAVGADTRLDRVLELVVKRGRAMVQARLMAVLVQEGDEVVVAAAAGEVDDSLLGMRIPLGESVSGEVMNSGRLVRMDDMSHQLRAGLAARIGAESGLFVPMVFQGRPLGVLNAFDRMEHGPGFDRDDEQIMQAFASSAAIAVATAEQAASQALRRSLEATERERSRWARELHDETLQELAALSIRLAGARNRESIEEVRNEIDAAVGQATMAAQELRGLITDLRPAALDQLGLQPALESLIERVRASTGLEVDLVADLAYESGRAARRPDIEQESAAYRLVQEALSNVVKHADVRSASVSIVERNGDMAIVVHDDGMGFDARDESAGFGLIGMRERVALAGGTVQVQSSAGEGTTIRATLPTGRQGGPGTGLHPRVAGF